MEMTYYSCGEGFQVFDFIEGCGLGFNLGNCAKYIARCGRKGNDEDAIQDLRKAIAYLEREIMVRQRLMDDLEGLAEREAKG